MANAAASQELVSLAAEPGWLKLGHYIPDRHSPSGWRSAIHVGDFFLDSEGVQDPVRELEATLVAFTQPLTKDVNAHAQCRFPARWLWLMCSASWDASRPEPPRTRPAESAAAARPRDSFERIIMCKTP